MELATVTSKGQITIPRFIRKKMNLKQGDKVLFIEDGGRCFLQNSNTVSLSNFQSAMKGAAQEAGFNAIEDVDNYVKALRSTKTKKK